MGSRTRNRSSTVLLVWNRVAAEKRTGKENCGYGRGISGHCQ